MVRAIGPSPDGPLFAPSGPCGLLPVHSLDGAAAPGNGPYPHSSPLHVLLFEHALPVPAPQSGARPGIADEPRTVYAFASRSRAAKWCLHAYRQV